MNLNTTIFNFCYYSETNLQAHEICHIKQISTEVYLLAPLCVVSLHPTAHINAIMFLFRPPLYQLYRSCHLICSSCVDWLAFRRKRRVRILMRKKHLAGIFRWMKTNYSQLSLVKYCHPVELDIIMRHLWPFCYTTISIYHPKQYNNDVQAAKLITAAGAEWVVAWPTNLL